jgi:pilus assembly protein Flp/PilA
MKRAASRVPGCVSAAPAGLRKGICVRKWYDRLKHLVEAEDGPTAVEYAVMLALIIVVCIGTITTLGANTNKTFNNAALNAAAGGSGSSSS